MVNGRRIMIASHHSQAMNIPRSCSKLYARKGHIRLVLFHLPGTILGDLPDQHFDKFRRTHDQGQAMMLDESLLFPIEVHELLSSMYSYKPKNGFSSRMLQDAFMYARFLEIIVVISYHETIRKKRQQLNSISKKITLARELLNHDLQRSWTLDLISNEIGISRKKTYDRIQEIFGNISNSIPIG